MIALHAAKGLENTACNTTKQDFLMNFQNSRSGENGVHPAQSKAQGHGEKKAVEMSRTISVSTQGNGDDGCQGLLSQCRWSVTLPTRNVEEVTV